MMKIKVNLRLQSFIKFFISAFLGFYFIISSSNFSAAQRASIYNGTYPINEPPSSRGNFLQFYSDSLKGIWDKFGSGEFPVEWEAQRNASAMLAFTDDRFIYFLALEGTATIDQLEIVCLLPHFGPRFRDTFMVSHDGNGLKITLMINDQRKVLIVGPRLMDRDLKHPPLRFEKPLEQAPSCKTIGQPPLKGDRHVRN